MISNSNSLCRERDAHSSARRTTSRHLRYRAVPRAIRTLNRANIHDHSATSSTTEPPACVPSLPWQCFCADASPGECTDASRQDGYVPLLFSSAGVLTRNHPYVRADLLATLKPRRSSDDQHIRQCRERPHARMRHQSQHLGSLPGFPLGRCG